jgi:hypothetical protein
VQTINIIEVVRSELAAAAAVADGLFSLSETLWSLQQQASSNLFLLPNSFIVISDFRLSIMNFYFPFLIHHTIV